MTMEGGSNLAEGARDERAGGEAGNDARPARRSIKINEDWAATVFGLVLLFLVLAGILTLDWLP